jgi:hypothetical protein
MYKILKEEKIRLEKFAWSKYWPSRAGDRDKGVKTSVIQTLLPILNVSTRGLYIGKYPRGKYQPMLF